MFRSPGRSCPKPLAPEGVGFLFYDVSIEHESTIRPAGAAGRRATCRANYVRSN